LYIAATTNYWRALIIYIVWLNHGYPRHLPLLYSKIHPGLPDQCLNMALFDRQNSPSARRSKWTGAALIWIASLFCKSYDSRVVLQAGDTCISRITGFIIVSLDLTFQCNTRAGGGRIHTWEVECGFWCEIEQEILPERGWTQLTNPWTFNGWPFPGASPWYDSAFNCLVTVVPRWSVHWLISTISVALYCFIRRGVGVTIICNTAHGVL
jgi:hypothetical protein